jgi:hypothetical protein
MAKFRKFNMSKFNRQIKAAQRKVERQNKAAENKTIRDLKQIERTYQQKLRSTSAPFLRSMPSLYLDQPAAEPHSDGEYNEKEYDVFISHAHEDKEAVARPLAHALKERGLSVWYDEFELKIGDSLRRKIDSGISKSNFGAIVISRTFIKKGWANYELDGLVTRSIDGQQRLLIIWHDITKREVINYSASLADKVARSTAEFTTDEIAKQIADLILFQKRKT